MHPLPRRRPPRIVATGSRRVEGGREEGRGGAGRTRARADSTQLTVPVAVCERPTKGKGGDGGTGRWRAVVGPVSAATSGGKRVSARTRGGAGAAAAATAATEAVAVVAAAVAGRPLSAVDPGGRRRAAPRRAPWAVPAWLARTSWGTRKQRQRAPVWSLRRRPPPSLLCAPLSPYILSCATPARARRGTDNRGISAGKRRRRPAIHRQSRRRQHRASLSPWTFELNLSWAAPAAEGLPGWRGQRPAGDAVSTVVSSVASPNRQLLG